MASDIHTPDIVSNAAYIVKDPASEIGNTIYEDQNTKISGRSHGHKYESNLSIKHNKLSLCDY